MIKNRNRRVFLRSMSCICALALAACATSTDQPKVQPQRNTGPALPRAIQRVPPKVLPATEFSETRPIKLIVRSTRPGEVMSEWYESQKKAMEVVTVGGTTGALAVTSVPAVMGSAAILLGGVMLAVGGAMILSVENNEQDQMVAAVAQTDFPSRIQSVLARRLKVADGGTEEVPTVEVLTVAYGVIEQKQQESVCIVAEIVLRVTADGIERYKDSVLIYPDLRSVDAPTPDCRTREVMAANHGEVVRTTLEVFAHAIPALLQKRLPGLPWKS